MDASNVAQVQKGQKMKIAIWNKTEGHMVISKKVKDQKSADRFSKKFISAFKNQDNYYYTIAG